MGLTSRPSWKSVGTQYAAVSALVLHVVAARRRLAGVEYASVDVLPKNVCGWERPGWPGWTMGSSGAVWLNLQLLKKLLPRSFGCFAGAAGRQATSAIAAPRAT